MSQQTQVGQQFHHSTLFRENGHICKHIEPNVTFNHDDGLRMKRRILTYHRLVGDVGIRTSSPYRIELHDGKLYEFTTNYGPDVIALMRADHQPLYWARRIVRTILPLLTAPSHTLGFDPVPGNFCVNSNDELVCVDFAPPRFVDEGVPLVGFPQPTEEAELRYAFERYYLPFGMVRKLWFILVRIDPTLSESFLDVLQEELPPSLMDELNERFGELPYTRVKHDVRLLPEIVSGFTLHNLDDIREIAHCIISLNGLRGEFLQRIFDLTHGDYRIPIQERLRRFEVAKRELIHLT